MDIEQAGQLASMKVPPKRKGNARLSLLAGTATGLNESPSEKEGKSDSRDIPSPRFMASMKVPPKRKGNCERDYRAVPVLRPQ